MELTWHGHSTWQVTVDSTTLLIDPFFDNPHTSLSASDVPTPDYLVCTHGHADHIADVDSFTDTTVVATPELCAYLEAEHGVTESIGMNLGGTVECGDATVTMVRADHTNGAMTTYEYDLGLPVGVLISDGEPASATDSTTFYHAGDTSLHTEMDAVIGDHLAPDVAALPVGDHFTMGPRQAAIATEWLDVGTVVPMHYDTFPPIEIDVSDFESAVAERTPQTDVIVLDGDESITV
ncbi:metal-dependent hydrolase [Halocatena halophila]|uniref:metal-dependent hydrolase n=1 Tax=Halocatena halophila TaxID=2814576 RepID=UPI002ED0DF23